MPEKKLITVPYGVDTQLFKPFPKKDDNFRIIYVGLVVVRKGILYLLQAVEQLKLRPDQVWVIGHIAKECLPLIRKYFNKVTFLGGVRHQQLAEYFSQGSVFVLPTLDDGFGLVILEAMASGLPVICTDHSAGADVVREGVDGFVVPVRDAGAIKQRIEFMMEDKKRCMAMGNSALERVRTRFTWEKYGEALLKAYAAASLVGGGAK